MTEARTIVIYEEDALTRTLLKEWLADAGYVVRIGDRCDPQADAPCHLVITNVYNPKQAGTRCVSDLQEAHPGTPMIAISGQFRPGLDAAGSTAQMLRVQLVAAKPLARKELLESVRATIRESS